MIGIYVVDSVSKDVNDKLKDEYRKIPLVYYS